MSPPNWCSKSWHTSSTAFSGYLNATNWCLKMFKRWLVSLIRHWFLKWTNSSCKMKRLKILNSNKLEMILRMWSIMTASLNYWYQILKQSLINGSLQVFRCKLLSSIFRIQAKAKSVKMFPRNSLTAQSMNKSLQTCLAHQILLHFFQHLKIYRASLRLNLNSLW